MRIFLAKVIDFNQNKLGISHTLHHLVALFVKSFVSKFLLLLGLLMCSMSYIAYAQTQNTHSFLPQKPLTAMQGSFLAWYQQCAKKNYTSCGLVGRSYYEGYGVLPNIDKAKYYFTKACYNGIVESCLLLGNFAKENTKQEYIALLYQQACDLDHKESCLQLSDILLKELKKDTTDSKKKQISSLFDKICKLEDDKECFRKRAFDAQVGDNMDMLLAIEFQQVLAACKKAQQDYADDMRSCGEVGIKYANGLGVDKDKQEAQTYFHIACKKHNEFCRYEILDSILN